MGNARFLPGAQSNPEHETRSAQHHESKYDEKLEKTKPRSARFTAREASGGVRSNAFAGSGSTSIGALWRYQSAARPWAARGLFQPSYKIPIRKKGRDFQRLLFSREPAESPGGYPTSAYW
jgi:hypothetical protein